VLVGRDFKVRPVVGDKVTFVFFKRLVVIEGGRESRFQVEREGYVSPGKSGLQHGAVGRIGIGRHICPILRKLGAEGVGKLFQTARIGVNLEQGILSLPITTAAVRLGDRFPKSFIVASPPVILCNDKIARTVDRCSGFIKGGAAGDPGAAFEENIVLFGFEIVIQTGAMLAIVWEYRAKFAGVIAGLARERQARPRLVVNVRLACARCMRDASSANPVIYMSCPPLNDLVAKIH